MVVAPEGYRLAMQEIAVDELIPSDRPSRRGRDRLRDDQAGGLCFHQLQALPVEPAAQDRSCLAQTTSEATSEAGGGASAAEHVATCRTDSAPSRVKSAAEK